MDNIDRIEEIIAVLREQMVFVEKPEHQRHPRVHTTPYYIDLEAHTYQFGLRVQALAKQYDISVHYYSLDRGKTVEGRALYNLTVDGRVVIEQKAGSEIDPYILDHLENEDIHSEAHMSIVRSGRQHRQECNDLLRSDFLLGGLPPPLYCYGPGIYSQEWRNSW